MLGGPKSEGSHLVEIRANIYLYKYSTRITSAFNSDVPIRTFQQFTRVISYNGILGELVGSNLSANMIGWLN